VGVSIGSAVGCTMTLEDNYTAVSPGVAVSTAAT
jgi:hypothetical protein